MQLGNLDVAKAGRALLTDLMLRGLHGALTQRLSKYVTPDVEADRAALAQMEADGAR